MQIHIFISATERMRSEHKFVSHSRPQVHKNTECSSKRQKVEKFCV